MSNEEPFFLAHVGDIWQGIKSVNWWHEIKEAFCFTEYDRYSIKFIDGSRLYSCYCIQCHKYSPGEFSEEDLIAIGDDLGYYKLCCPTCSNENKRQPQNDPDFPAPVNLTPYYIAALVFVAVLIFHGFLTEWGVVDYSVTLK